MWLNPVRARKFIHGSTSRSRTQQRGRVGSPVWFVAIFVNTVEKPVLCMLTQPYSRGNTVVRYVCTVRSIRRSCSIGPAKVDRDLHPWNIIPLCPFFPPILRPAGGAYAPPHTTLTRARHLAHFCGRALRRRRNCIAKCTPPLFFHRNRSHVDRPLIADPWIMKRNVQQVPAQRLILQTDFAVEDRIMVVGVGSAWFNCNLNLP